MAEKEERIERMMKQMDQFDKAEAADFITDMMEQIKEPVKRIPENVFREIFLPVFAGLDPDLEKRTGEFTAHWAGVVGSAMEPADIVDVQGNKLFTVPPLYDNTRLNTEDQKFGVESYRHIFGSLIDNASVNPRAAVGEFSEAATKRLDALIKPAVEQRNPWEEVFSYYNLIEKPETEATAADSSKKIDDDFTFDE